MRSLFCYIEAVAPTSLPILITGETGAGKELFARAVHQLSGRTGELVPVNIAGIDGGMLSDMLFGHKRGAFTGADRDRTGLIARATQGTLFLDEIGDLSAESQIKLLRLLQDRHYYPVGSDIALQTDARIVAATNRDLEELQRDGRFRRDLFFRLQAHHIHIPPLRHRRDDLPVLLDHFMDKASLELGKRRPTTPPELLQLLGAYHFPGNVRELEGMIFDAVSRHRFGVLSTHTFSDKIERGSGLPMKPDAETHGEGDSLAFGPSLPTLKQLEEDLIAEALRRADGNQTIAARILGMSRQALNNRLRRQKPK